MLEVSRYASISIRVGVCSRADLHERASNLND